LFTRELQKRLGSSADTRGISVNCFNPGLIVSTGLFRDQNPFFTKIFDVAATDLLKVGETPAWGGGALAYMTNVDSKGLYYSSDPGSSKYGDLAFGNQFNVVTPSVEARDDEKAKRLWELSEKLVGISSV
jgi:protochlorophyllide reductase